MHSTKMLYGTLAAAAVAARSHHRMQLQLLVEHAIASRHGEAVLLVEAG